MRIIAFRFELSPSGTVGVAGVDAPIGLLRDVALIPLVTLLAPGDEKEVTLLAMTTASVDVRVPVR